MTSVVNKHCEATDNVKAYNDAFNFLMDFVKKTTGLTDEEVEGARQRVPSLSELGAAVFLAVYHKVPYSKAYSKALDIIKYWGKLSNVHLTYDEAVEFLAYDKEYAEGMKGERGSVADIAMTVAIWEKLDEKDLLDVMDAGLRVLYEYHLWDLEAAGDETQVENKTA